MSDVLTMSIKRKYSWSCECGMRGGDWDYWETAELVVVTHRKLKHMSVGSIEGYDLRPGGSNDEDS